jgi:phosphatidylinositol alpha-1,6-mannosyltransferase
VQVPATLLVTNDFPPRIGGIQRTLEALWRELPADRVGVFCPDWDDAEAYDAAVPFRVFRQPERFLWPTRGVADRVEAAARTLGAGGAVRRHVPSRCWDRGWRRVPWARRTASSTGSRSRPAHTLMRRATGARRASGACGLHRAPSAPVPAQVPVPCRCCTPVRTSNGSIPSS